MKYFLLILLPLLPAVVSARVITVNNNAGSPSVFSNLQTAVDSAANGDTLYVQGSQTDYGNVTITKRLVLIGAGYRPNKSNPLPSKLNIVAIDSVATGANAGESASGTVLMGFEISKLGSLNNLYLRQVLIKRNRFIKNPNFNFAGISLLLVNSTIEQNIFDTSSATDFDLGLATNCLIRNNIIGCPFRNSSGGAVLINNVFVGQANAFVNVSNALVANSIFYGMAPQGCSSSTFSNNMTFNTSNNTLPYGTNGGSGNFNGTNPQFVNVTQYVFDYTQDYRLQSSSPGKAAGTDATDIGLYGGGAPMPAYGGEPPIPQIKSFTVAPVVKKNSTLQINVKAKKQD
jgi:hypothetical protein